MEPLQGGVLPWLGVKCPFMGRYRKLMNKGYKQEMSKTACVSIAAPVNHSFGPECRRTVTTRDGLLGPPSPSGSPQCYRQRLSVADTHKMPGRLGRCPYNTSEQSLLLKFSCTSDTAIFLGPNSLMTVNSYDFNLNHKFTFTQRNLTWFSIWTKV